MAVNNLKIDKSKIDKFVLYGGKTAKTAQAVVNELKEKPDYIINAGHFDNSKKSKTYGMTIVDTIVDNEFINGGNYNSTYENQGLAWNNVNDICLQTTYYTKQMEKDWKYYLAGSPCLIKNGVMNTNKYLKSTFANQLTKRIGIGVTDKQIIFHFPLYNAKATKVADYLKSCGCKNAILLDGGGSQFVGQVVNGKVKHLDNNNQNRAVSTWFLIYLKKDKVAAPTTPTVSNTTSTSSNLISTVFEVPKVYKVTATSLNMRTAPNINSAIHTTSIKSGKLKKNDKITVFEIVYNNLFNL
jgi:exopolysaccharide biosynthesis protein